MSVRALAPESVERLRRRALTLAGVTIAWNVAIAGLAAREGLEAIRGDDDHDDVARPVEGGETP